jgi:hypothetical protein
MSPAL